MAVDKAVLLGSYAKDIADAFSDIDICFFLNNYDGKRRADAIGEMRSISNILDYKNALQYLPDNNNRVKYTIPL